MSAVKCAFVIQRQVVLSIWIMQLLGNTVMLI